MEKKRNKIIRRILFWSFAAVLYIQVGNIWSYWFDYINYYPRSTAVYILVPHPDLWIDSSDINQETGVSLRRAGNVSFKEYHSAHNQWQWVLFGPIIQIFIYLSAIALWIIQIIVWIMEGVWWAAYGISEIVVWIWNGGLARAFGIIH